MSDRIARCIERVLNGQRGEAPVTVVEMLLIAKRIREADGDGALPDEAGYTAPAQPAVESFTMFPI